MKHSRFKQPPCYFCTQTVADAFTISIISPQKSEYTQMMNSRILTGCDCLFSTHAICWYEYISSPGYNGCPICSKPIPQQKEKRTDHILCGAIWREGCYYKVICMVLVFLFSFLFLYALIKEIITGFPSNRGLRAGYR